MLVGVMGRPASPLVAPVPQAATVNTTAEGSTATAVERKTPHRSLSWQAWFGWIRQ
ncbi:hypothetical protein [Kribbella sp. NPDC051718]|uniref:hypothetical protein n=1 Tax=Kribbella sp. NPDC051718 TaxID=3155168 RepID=UPI003419362D